MNKKEKIFWALAILMLVIALAFMESGLAVQKLKIQLKTEEASEKEKPQIQDSWEKVSLIKVIDGDTIVVRRKNAKESVRIIGIDTPETTTLKKGYTECFAQEAEDFAKEFFADGVLYLELDESQGERDKYNRLLAHVFSSGGYNFAEKAIQGGYSRHYVFNSPSKYYDDLEEAQGEAVEENIGMYKECED